MPGTHCLTALAYPGVQEKEITQLLIRIRELGGMSTFRRAGDRLLLVAWGAATGRLTEELTAAGEIEEIRTDGTPYPLAARAGQTDSTVVDVAGVAVGGPRVTVIAGPCSAESPEVLLETAQAVRSMGATLLRVGIFKPRTSPYSFQGLGHTGLDALRELRPELGLPVVSEVMSVRDIEAMAATVDVLQVGARNMQNFALLKELGRVGWPVLLKRGMSASVSEWLHAAEYLMAHGNQNVILCERGIRTFEEATRFTLDLNAVPVLKELTHLPVLVDPSHGTGKARYVAPMARAAVAAGADGVIVEVHPRPAEALSDGEQSLDFTEFESLTEQLGRTAEAVGRSLLWPAHTPKAQHLAGFPG
jgi:3-deoxy-7-phosphoheptulonate synthase